MPSLIENAVTLADLAKVTKTTVAKLEDECRALLIYIGVDWANRPAISATEAHGIVTGEARRRHAESAAWATYAEQAEAWTRARDEAVSIASNIASRKATLAFEGQASAQQAGLEAGREAGRQYEQEHPAPVWTDGSSPLVDPKFTDGGLLRRAINRMAGAA